MSPHRFLTTVPFIEFHRGYRKRSYRPDRYPEEVPAVITKIDRIKTRQGDSLFLKVDVNGETVRAFGRPEDLAEPSGNERLRHSRCKDMHLVASSCEPARCGDEGYAHVTAANAAAAAEDGRRKSRTIP